MSFVELAVTFEQIEATSSRNEMTELLAGLFGQLSPQEARIVSYLVLGQLNPPYIPTRFLIAEKLMKAVVATVVQEDEAVIGDQVKQYGDSGAVIAHYSWQYNSDISIEQVYASLIALEHVSGSGSQDQRAHLLQVLLKGVSPSAAKYIVRIILGKLRLGFSDMTLLDAFSWMLVGNKTLKASIEQAYNMSADIGRVAYYLVADGIDGIKHMKVEVGIPIRPASAERMPSVGDIIKRLGHCIAQLKLDGFRVQIHIDKSAKTPRVNFFSRHLADISDMFPDLIEPLLALPVTQLICEGEAICYEPNTGDFLPFQETVKRMRKYDIEQMATEYPLKVFLFDLLFLDGQQQMTTTHAERRKILQTICVDQTDESFVQLIEEKKIKDEQELNAYFLESIDKGLEGLVVKRPDAHYQPGKRNFNWIKLKRAEGGHLRDTIDCVILGYYAGRGRRAQFGIGAFLVGIYNKSKDMFETIAKIGTGVKDDEWITLKKRCDDLAVAQKPKEVICAKELIPDVWVQPEIVCEVYADEITVSPTHTAGKSSEADGYALRFPRLVGHREDKGAMETTTVEELRRLHSIQTS